MPIQTITNNTGIAITLRDGNTDLMTLANGQSGHALPVTITGVSAGNRNFSRRVRGSFVNNDSYSATLNGNTITFTGHQATVVFSV